MSIWNRYTVRPAFGWNTLSEVWTVTSPQGVEVYTGGSEERARWLAEQLTANPEFDIAAWVESGYVRA